MKVNLNLICIFMSTDAFFLGHGITLDNFEFAEPDVDLSDCSLWSILGRNPGANPCEHAHKRCRAPAEHNCHHDARGNTTSTGILLISGQKGDFGFAKPISHLPGFKLKSGHWQDCRIAPHFITQEKYCQPATGKTPGYLSFDPPLPPPLPPMCAYVWRGECKLRANSAPDICILAETQVTWQAKMCM